DRPLKLDPFYLLRACLSSFGRGKAPALRVPLPGAQAAPKVVVPQPPEGAVGREKARGVIGEVRQRRDERPLEALDAPLRGRRRQRRLHAVQMEREAPAGLVADDEAAADEVPETYRVVVVGDCGGIVARAQPMLRQPR